jgi:hypothetical protein
MVVQENETQSVLMNGRNSLRRDEWTDNRVGSMRCAHLDGCGRIGQPIYYFEEGQGGYQEMKKLIVLLTVVVCILAANAAMAADIQDTTWTNSHNSNQIMDVDLLSITGTAGDYTWTYKVSGNSDPLSALTSAYQFQLQGAAGTFQTGSNNGTVSFTTSPTSYTGPAWISNSTDGKTLTWGGASGGNTNPANFTWNTSGGKVTSATFTFQSSVDTYVLGNGNWYGGQDPPITGQIDVPNVGSPAVPEPFSMLLGTLGFGALAGLRKLRKATA